MNIREFCDDTDVARALDVFGDLLLFSFKEGHITERQFLGAGTALYDARAYRGEKMSDELYKLFSDTLSQRWIAAFTDLIERSTE